MPKPSRASPLVAIATITTVGLVAIAGMALSSNPVHADDELQSAKDEKFYASNCLAPYLYLSGEDDAQFGKLVALNRALTGATREQVLDVARTNLADNAAYYAHHPELDRRAKMAGQAASCAAKLGIGVPGSQTPDTYDARLDPFTTGSNVNQFCAWVYVQLTGSEDDTFKSLVVSAAAEQDLEIDQVVTFTRRRHAYVDGLIAEGAVSNDTLNAALDQCESKGALINGHALVAAAQQSHAAAEAEASRQREAEAQAAQSDSGHHYLTWHDDPYIGMTCLQAVDAMGKALREDRERYDDGPAPESTECLSGGFDDSCYTTRSQEGIANVQAYCHAIRQQMSYDTVSNRCTDMGDYLRDTIMPSLHCDRWAPQ